MFKAKSKEIVKCTYCGDEIDCCDQCNVWFDDDEEIYCDEVRSHYCRKCGKPLYKKSKIEKGNSTLDEYS